MSIDEDLKKEIQSSNVNKLKKLTEDEKRAKMDDENRRKAELEKIREAYASQGINIDEDTPSE